MHHGRDRGPFVAIALVVACLAPAAICRAAAAAAAAAARSRPLLRRTAPRFLRSPRKPSTNPSNSAVNTC
jgi:hypothetical protein